MVVADGAGAPATRTVAMAMAVAATVRATRVERGPRGKPRPALGGDLARRCARP